MNSTMELPIVYTSASTLGDLSKTAKGRIVFEHILQMIAKRNSSRSSSNAALGEGSERMEQAMFLGMPIHALHTYGMINAQQLDQMLQYLNS